MAKNANTYEKRRKEMERKRKAQEKREKRFARRASSANTESPDGSPTVREPDQSDAQTESPAPDAVKDATNESAS